MAKGRKAKGGRRQRGSPKPEDEKALWQAFAEGIDRLDLKGHVPDTDTSFLDEMLREAMKTERATAAGANSKPKQKSPGVAKNEKKPAPQLVDIDARQVRRIGKGRSDIDARIDLHGMRQSEAHSALRKFLCRSVAKGHRMVLVITGKGSAASSDDDGGRYGSFINEGALGRGVLRRNVPLWLAEPELRAIVVGYTTAHIRHGGEGALYVQLRKGG